MRQTSLQCIYQLARRDPRVYFIGSDLGAGTLEEFRREMPARFVMGGVSEAALIGIAAGLALDGKIPYINTIASFLTRRGFEQIVADLCLHGLRVRLIGSGGGFVYAPLGPTHMAIEDLTIMRALPNMTVVAPADAPEMRRMMEASLDHPGPIYVRLGKGGDPLVTPGSGPFVFGEAVPLRGGTDALLVTTGTLARACLEAAGMLEAKGIDTAVLHFPTVKPLDPGALLEAARPVGAVVSVEEHTVVGGLGSAVAEVLAGVGWKAPKPLAHMGIPHIFPDRYGSQASLRARFGLTPEAIVETVVATMAAPPDGDGP